jgi:hypothetical protein
LKTGFEMRKTFRAIQHWLFGDVERILGGFTKLERKLERAVNFHNMRAEEARIAAEVANAARSTAQAAATRAQTVKTNISNLLGA